MTTATDVLRKLLDECGIEWKDGDAAYEIEWSTPDGRHCSAMYWKPTFTVLISGCTPEQAIAATLGRPKAKAHPYGYEPDTGAFDCTRCECGCINDISATYCNDCGGEIEIDMYAEKEIYHTLRHLVFAEKHDDGSLEFGGKRYVAATLRSGKLTADDVLNAVYKHGARWQAIADELNSRADYHGYEQAAIEAWESIKAWNSRAERTCEFNIKDNMNETEGMGDVWIECSACNCVFDFYADEWLMKMSYCPNCGARRVGE